MPDKILYVDDDPNILNAYQRMLGRKFDVSVANDGAEGLEIIKRQGPFALVLSDLRMPGMDGIRFLAAVHDYAPDTVCIMLTGNADLDSAINAVNEGRIFRFLTKPCPPELLAASVRDGLRQYRLIVAERELLQKTLTGSIKVLTEILSLVNPTAFSRATRISRYTRHVVNKLGLSQSWQYEIAALLSQLGCVTLSTNTLDKIYAGKSLSENETNMFNAHPGIARKLLGHIPRLEAISAMIEGQLKPYHVMSGTVPQGRDTEIATGAQILHAVQDFDSLVLRGTHHQIAIRQLTEQQGQYNPAVLNALEDAPTTELDVAATGTVIQAVTRDLRIGMYACEDIMTMNGLLLVPKWHQITEPILIRLHNFAVSVGIKEPLRILVPTDMLVPDQNNDAATPLAVG